MQNINNNIMQI